MTVAFTASGLPTSMWPVGMITPYGGSTATIPAGWLLCNGSTVSRQTYAALFTVISTTYGIGDGSTTFNLPDYTDAYPYGANAGSNFTNANSHSHSGSQSFSPTVTGGGADGSDATHAHNTSTNLDFGGIGSHTHNQNIGFNSGNSNSNAAKAAGNTVAVQGSAHDHNVAGGWNAATDSHNHSWNASGASSSSGYGLHVHESNANLNTNKYTSGNVNAPTTSANHEINNFQTLFIIKT